MKPLSVSQSFRDRADGAAFWEAWVGATLARQGIVTVHHPFVIDGKDHGQTWDLTCMPAKDVPNGGLIFDNVGVTSTSVSVEVKSLSLTFTGPNDYPFHDVLLCSQNSWIKKWSGRDYTVRDFLLVSTKTGKVVWVPAMSHVTLGHEVRDSKRNELYKAVITSKGHLRPLEDFVELLNDIGQ